MAIGQFNSDISKAAFRPGLHRKFRLPLKLLKAGPPFFFREEEIMRVFVEFLECFGVFAIGLAFAWHVLGHK